MPVYLSSESLCSKWGFSDGDLLDDFAYDAGIECDTRVALVALVRSHLLPLITCEFEVYEIVTNHNPIRFRSWRGIKVDDYEHHRVAGFEAVEVEVSDADVMAALLAAVEIPELAKGGIVPAGPALQRIADDVVECLIPLTVYDRLVPRQSGRSVFGSPTSSDWSFTTTTIDGDELSHRKALQLFLFGWVNPHAALVLVPESDRFGARLSWQMRCAADAFVRAVDEAVGPLTQFLAEIGRLWRDEDWAARKRRGGAMRDYRRKTRRRNRRRR